MKHPLSLLKGLGTKRQDVLRSAGIHSCEDLVEYIPRRYLDRTKILTIASVKEFTEAQIRGQIIRANPVFGRGSRFVATLADSSGEIDLIFFNQISSMAKKLTLGSEWIAVGRVARFGRMQIVHPELEACSIETPLPAGIVPIYPSSEAFKNSRIENRALRQWMNQIFELSTFRISNLLPNFLLSDLGLMDRLNCLKYLHLPKSFAQVYQSKRQLKIEEILPLALAMAWRRHKQKERGQAIQSTGKISQQLCEQLPFELTPGQAQALKSLAKGLCSPVQYQALVQGDVGSGKTAVAALAIALVLESPNQVALLAPTEILCRQHFAQFQTWFEPLGFRVRLILGSLSSSERKDLIQELKSGDCHILIGTHAIFSSDIEFQNLRLVVIDEQHRFGVQQRQALMHKGKYPDLISLSATPIPRSLASTWYGDMDAVVMAGKPLGRQTIQSRMVPSHKRPGLIQWIGESIQKGERVYWVLPKVGSEDDESSSQSVASIYQELNQIFSKQVSFIHGKLPEDEKIQALEQFRSGQKLILVATTVIEVGVNIPEANIIVIEGAERFGLSQLHQLRGRVGRGQKEAWCFLLSENEDAQERLKAFCQTEDGFVIAEIDLEQRGAGDLLGADQSGLKPFRHFDYITDMDLVVQMREYSEKLLSSDQIEVKKWIVDTISQFPSLSSAD